MFKPKPAKGEKKKRVTVKKKLEFPKELKKEAELPKKPAPVLPERKELTIGAFTQAFEASTAGANAFIVHRFKENIVECLSKDYGLKVEEVKDWGPLLKVLSCFNGAIAHLYLTTALDTLMINEKYSTEIEHITQISKTKLKVDKQKEETTVSAKERMELTTPVKMDDGLIPMYLTDKF